MNSSHYRGQAYRNYATMLPTPSVSRNRSCVPSVRHPRLTTVAAVILVVACLYHARGFTPSYMSTPTVDRAAEKSAFMKDLAVPINGVRAPVIAGDEKMEPADTSLGHMVQDDVNGSVKEDDVEDDAPGQIDTNVKESEAGGDDVIENMSPVTKDAEEADAASEDMITTEKEKSVDDEASVSGFDAAEKQGNVESEEATEEIASSAKDDVTEDDTVRDELNPTDKEETATGETAAEDVATSEKEETVADNVSEKDLDVADREDAAGEDAADSTLTEGVDTSEKMESEVDVDEAPAEKELEGAADKASVVGNVDGNIGLAEEEEEEEEISGAAVDTADKIESESRVEDESAAEVGSGAVERKESSSADLNEDDEGLVSSEKQEETAAAAEGSDESLSSAENKMETVETDSKLKDDELDGGDNDDASGDYSLLD